MEYEMVLCHHGVKGMKWGVRKKRLEERNQIRREKKAYREERAKERRKKLVHPALTKKEAVKKNRRAGIRRALGTFALSQTAALGLAKIGKKKAAIVVSNVGNAAAIGVSAAHIARGKQIAKAYVENGRY